MDKHPKDYFVPNFGVDHDIITTHNNYKNAGGKLVQKAAAAKDDMHCDSQGCPDAESAGKPYASIYHNLDYWHRPKEAPKSIPNWHYIKPSL